MSVVKNLPEGSGVNAWFELSKYKDYKFNDKTEIKDRYDYVVVGAGFGGVFAALQLSKNDPASSIALIDALPIGYFSSGRNAGFVTRTQFIKAIVGRKKFTNEDHAFITHLNNQVVDTFEDLIKEHKLDINWRHDGSYRGAVEPRSIAALKEIASSLEGIGLDFEHLDAQRTKERLGTDFYKESIYIPETRLINPSEAIRAFASVLPSNVKVFENTPVHEIIEGDRPQVVLKNGITINTDKVILTVSAFIRSFVQDKKTDPVAAIHSFGALTRVLNDDEYARFKDLKPWGLVGTHPSACTVRLTPYRRLFVRTDIAFASKLNINPDRLDKSVPLLRRAFDRRFKGLDKVQFEYIYGGLISFTGNSTPLFGEIKKNVYAGVTSDGTGVTRAAILGRYLADLIQDKKSDELDRIIRTYKPSYLPPEPVRTIGAGIALKIKDYQAGVEL